MNPTLAYLGDASIRRSPSTDRAHIRCIVWSTDLTADRAWRTARRSLKRTIEDITDASHGYPGLKHIVLTYRASPLHRRWLRGTGERLARTVHQELKRRRGRYVDIVLIDITDLPDLRLLDTRIEELANSSAGIVGYDRIDGEDLSAHSIKSLCARDII